MHKKCNFLKFKYILKSRNYTYVWHTVFGVIKCHKDEFIFQCF